MSTGATTQSKTQLFSDPEWLGYHHDGYDIAPLSQYCALRKEPQISGSESAAESEARRLAASMQSLLTLGILEAVMETHVPESMLVRRDESGRAFMTIAHLTELIQDWLSRISKTPTEEHAPWLARVNKNLVKAHSLMMSSTALRFKAFQPLGVGLPAMLCFIAVVCEALVNAKMVFKASHSPQGLSWAMIWTAEHRGMLRAEMCADGWCPFTTEDLVTTRSVSSLRYALESGPPVDGVRHNSCTDTHCAAYVVDTKTYQPKHAAACVEELCSYAQPDINAILGRVSGEGSIPVVTLREVGNNTSPRIDIQVYNSSDKPYVAISHVWADGLGSVSEVGLPTCQLRRLATVVAAVRPGAALWMDSLCIPASEAARKMAIKKMAQTYHEAETVLVLDAGLQQCKATDPSGTKMLRVLTSGWMRRLWTLQEAALAKDVSILLTDDALVDLAALIPPTHDIPAHPHLTDLSVELFRLSKRSKYGEYSLGDVARSLQWRSTNRPSDETLAIASLLGIQPSLLVDIDPEQRMMKLLQEVKHLPRNVLFLVGAKMKTPGFRWAPVSLMSAHGGSKGGLSMSPSARDALWTPRGLEATYTVLCFPPGTVKPGVSWRVRDEKQGRLYDIVDASVEGETYRCDILLFDGPLPSGGALPCVAGHRDGRLETPDETADGGFTVFCKYKRRLVIVDTPVEKGDIPATARAYLSGKLRLCVG